MEKEKKMVAEILGETVGVAVGGKWSKRGRDGEEDGGGSVKVQ